MLSREETWREEEAWKQRNLACLAGHGYLRCRVRDNSHVTFAFSNFKAR